MNHIYLYEGPFEKGDKGYPMIKEAARRYALENDLNLDLEQAEIVREEKGKPYFADLPLEFSLTHSGQLWSVCSASSLAASIYSRCSPVNMRRLPADSIPKRNGTTSGSGA